MKNNLLISVGILSAILLVVFLPIRIPSSLEVVGSIRPAREWIINVTNEDIITIQCMSNIENRILSHDVIEAERGDTFRLTVSSAVAPGTRISHGDTLVLIESDQLSQLLASLDIDLAVQRAELRAEEAGEKQPVIDAARERIRIAREQHETQQNIVDRLEALDAVGHVPYQDYELAKSQLNLYDISILEAEAELAALMSGSKREDLAVFEDTIAAIERQKSLVNDQLDRYALTVPFDGIVIESDSDSTIVTVADDSDFVAVIPVPDSRRGDISVGMTVLFNPGNGNVFEGEIVRISDRVRLMQDRPVAIVTARIDASGDAIRPYAVYNGRIPLGRFKLSEYLVRVFRAEIVR